jgi:hypothetical protein
MTDVTTELTSKATADSALGSIETALRTEVDAEQLPLVGSAIKNDFDGS